MCLMERLCLQGRRFVHHRRHGEGETLIYGHSPGRETGLGHAGKDEPRLQIISGKKRAVRCPVVLQLAHLVQDRQQEGVS
jgi:hypothetical protein